MYRAIQFSLFMVTVLLVVECALRLFGNNQFQAEMAHTIQLTPANEAAKLKGTSQELEDATRRCLTTLKGKPKVPHPYFGWVYNSALTPGVNRDGFFDPQDFSQISRGESNTVNIGIFGGSVASNFAVFQQERIARDQPSLVSDLRKNAPLIFQNKKVRILNFAIEGHKQPQQYFISSYFADKIDLAITIDGFNEIGYAFIDEFPVEFPGLSGLFFSKDPLRNLYIAKLTKSLQSQIDLTEFILQSWMLRSSYLIGYLWKIRNKLILNRITRAHVDHSAEVDRKFQYYNHQFSDDERLEMQATTWKKFSLLQDQLFKSQSIPHLHFLQPNQHLKGLKKLSREEKESFFSSEKASWISSGYQKLFSKLNILKSQGSNIIDLTPMFASVEETTYSDACCHLNDRGQTILTAWVLAAVVELYKAEESQNSLRQ
jgi:hypothetical protein